MMRSLIVLGAVTLALMAPVAALAVPVGALPVSHPMARASGSIPASSRAGTAAQQPFKVPFDLNVHPQWHERGSETTWTVPPRAGWHPLLVLFPYQPMWYQVGCPNGAFAEPGVSWNTSVGTSAPPTSFTIGSLAGQSSNLFGASPSDIARVTSSNSDAAASSKATLQYSAGTSCGSMNPLGF